MKKVFTLAIALVLALSLVVMASAAVTDDIKDFFAEISGTVSADQLSDAVQSVFADLDLPFGAEVNAGDLAEGTDKAVADGLIAKLGLEGTDIATKIQDAMSNDFVSFLAGMYTCEAPIITGDNSTVIAIATFATLSAAAAAAFVVMKKKEA